MIDYCGFKIQIGVLTSDLGIKTKTENLIVFSAQTAGAKFGYFLFYNLVFSRFFAPLISEGYWKF